MGKSNKQKLADEVKKLTAAKKKAVEKLAVDLAEDCKGEGADVATLEAAAAEKHAALEAEFKDQLEALAPQAPAAKKSARYIMAPRSSVTHGRKIFDEGEEIQASDLSDPADPKGTAGKKVFEGLVKSGHIVKASK